MTDTEEYDAFVSYHISDFPLATRVVATLERAGLKVWWDKGTRDDPAQGTLSEILLHLFLPMSVQCKYLVLISGTCALASDWVIVEMSFFIDAKRPTIMWHPREDASALDDLMGSRSRETYDEVVRLVGSPHIIAKLDRTRSEVDFVSKNIAQLLRLFNYIRGKGLGVSEATVKTEYPNYIRDDMDFMLEFLRWNLPSTDENAL